MANSQVIKMNCGYNDLQAAVTPPTKADGQIDICVHHEGDQLVRMATLSITRWRRFVQMVEDAIGQEEVEVWTRSATHGMKLNRTMTIQGYQFDAGHTVAVLPYGGLRPKVPAIIKYDTVFINHWFDGQDLIPLSVEPGMDDTTEGID